MVSKLAPAAYGTMMMGMWHVMIFFGNYTAGQLGEVYGTLDPATFFTRIGGSLIVVSLICFMVVKKVKSMMHGVN
jgi:dipeptide/tripeptide permease